MTTRGLYLQTTYINPDKLGSKAVSRQKYQTAVHSRVNLDLQRNVSEIFTGYWSGGWDWESKTSPP